MKSKRIFSLILAAGFALAGCSAGTNGTTASQDSTKAQETTTTASSNGGQHSASQTQTKGGSQDGSYRYSYKSMDGKSDVELKEEPQKLVSMSPAMTEVIYALGEGKRLVGRTDVDAFPKEVEKVASVGSMMEPSVEKIVSLSPDVVIVSFMKPEMAAKIKKGSTNVFSFPTGESFEGTYANMMEMAKLLNVKDKGEKLVEDIKAELAEISKKVASEPKVSCYYVVGFGESGDYTAGDKTFINDILTAAGGENVAKDAVNWKYSAEKLVEKDPKYIFIADDEAMVNAFKTTEPYKNLTAVKENRLIPINADLISREGPRMVEGVKAIAKALHPEAMK